MSEEELIKALKEMDTRIQIFDMEEMILLLNANLGERWYADFERLKSNFMKEMSYSSYIS